MGRSRVVHVVPEFFFGVNKLGWRDAGGYGVFTRTLCPLNLPGGVLEEGGW
jgi:hypothetical protein